MSSSKSIETAIKVGSVSELWNLYNTGLLSTQEQAYVQEHIRKIFMKSREASNAKQVCRLQSATGKACIGFDVKSTDFIHDKGVMPPLSTSRAERINERHLDRFSDTAGMLGSSANPCKIDKPYTN